jgi:hypothetical protein
MKHLVYISSPFGELHILEVGVELATLGDRDVVDREKDVVALGGARNATW